MHRVPRAVSAALAIATLLLPAHGLAEPPADPIAAAFGALEADPAPPESLTRGNHYVVSNENRLELFKDALEGRGGAYIGVGTDQNYLLGAWAGAEVLILLDFDQMVVDIHSIYRLMFAKAETPQELIGWWAKGKKKDVHALLDEGLSGDALQRAKEAYAFGRKWIEWRLKRVAKRLARLKIASFLTDQGQYDHIRRLYATNRVFAVRGDLTKATAMGSVARAAKAAGVPLRTIYLSNAEQYFKYDKQYTANMLAMPTDERSVIVRTIPDGNKGYYYLVQEAANFRRWLESGQAASVFTLYRKRKANPKNRERLFTIDKEPKAPKSAQR